MKIYKRVVGPFAILILLALVGQASAGPNPKMGESTTAVVSSTRFPGDFDWDFDVDFADFLAFVSVFGKTSADADYNPRMDMDGSGAIDFADFVAFAGVFGTTYTRPPWASDRDALMALYQATDGDGWTDRTNWLIDADPSTWHGVGVFNGRVTRLRLEENNLSGPIPPALGNLSNLGHLVLYKNALSGPIPSELGHLSNLNSLLLNGNALSGPIPSELGNLSNLGDLWLAGNALSGPIPSELGNLSSLKALLLNGNALSGPIPSELGKLSNLTGLWLHRNALSGSVPFELGKLFNLTSLRLYDNVPLTGTLPQSLTGLTNLKSFRFQDTGLCAPLDGAFQTWFQGIEDARGSTCPGGGTLSADRDALMALYQATDGDNWTDKTNWLTDADLSTWHGVTVSSGRVTRLRLDGNNLSGTIPAALGGLSSLQDLRLSGNALSGSIPPTLGDLSNLETLWLSGTALSGLIPPSLGDLSSLRLLLLYGNALSGSIPPH